MRQTQSIPNPVATVDLHGDTKTQAIRRLTEFMDRLIRSRPKMANVWVLVITGSGAHSKDGPVLRNAVESLFQKRQMNYTMNPGKGSFTVDARSGFHFFEPGQPEDTKVIVSDAMGNDDRALSRHRDRVRAPPSRLEQEANPLPAEVAATDAFIEESRIEGEKAFSLQKKEEKLLRKAVSMSMLEIEREEEEEAQLLQKAMSLSMIENLPEPNSSIEDEFQKALELSKQEFQKEREEDPLELALKLSEQIVSKEDEELLRILEESKLQY